MTLNDSSSLILIVDAIAILAFVVHGLWFSGRSTNRKLNKTSKEDQEIVLSNTVGKVRIIRPKSLDNPVDVTAVRKDIPHLNSKAKSKVEPTVNLSPSFSLPQKESVQNTYELNILATMGRAYKGLDLEELFNAYGLFRNDKDIFVVHESASSNNVVFRLCSLEAPYSFPKDMSNFATKQLAVYMQLPPKGKAHTYFKAMRIAADTIIEHLGGSIVDNSNKEVSTDKLDRIEKILYHYDKDVE